VDGLSLFALACALAMDAFAVAVVTGLTLDPLTRRQVLRLYFHFGLFQALMPAIGWAAGMAVHRYIEAFDHWIAFGLLAFVGGRMLWEARQGEDGEGREGEGGEVREGEHGRQPRRDPTAGWSLAVLSVATSVDALAVGLSLAMIGSEILVPALVIGVVAFGFTAAGMRLGRRADAAWGRRVEVLGGVVLIGIGLRILVEHLR
jgi:putative Mn2+ efflux pump MntP